MVSVWAADITPLLIEETYRAYYNKVPEWRKEKADKLRNMEDRARSVGAWSLWEKIQEMTELPEHAVFNLSHSGKYVLCACSDREGVQVGCDVEMTGVLRMAVAERYFCPAECEIIRAGIQSIDQGQTEAGGDEKEQTEWFYRFWVLKESFMKATRRGMGLDMRTYEFAWGLDGIPYMRRQPEEYPGIYLCREYELKQGEARAAVITTDEEIEGRLHEIRLA